MGGRAEGQSRVRSNRTNWRGKTRSTGYGKAEERRHRQGMAAHSTEVSWEPCVRRRGECEDRRRSSRDVTATGRNERLMTGVGAAAGDREKGIWKG